MRYEPDTPDSPQDPNGTNNNPIYPCPAGYERKDGVWDAECVPSNQVPVGPCPDGQEQSPFAADGSDAIGTLECVSHAEAQSRFDKRKAQNNNNAQTSSSSSSSSSSSTKPADLNPNFSSQSIWDRTSSLWDSLLAQGNNLKPRWNADNTALVKGQLRQATAGNAAAEKKALMAQKAATGQLTQGTTQRQLRGIGEKANTNYASGATGIDVKAVGENFDDQIAILDQKRNNIIQYGSFQLALAGSDQAAASIRNSMSIALAQIQQQKDALQKQLDMQKWLAQFGVGTSSLYA